MATTAKMEYFSNFVINLSDWGMVSIQIWLKALAHFMQNKTKFIFKLHQLFNATMLKHLNKTACIIYHFKTYEAAFI